MEMPVIGLGTWQIVGEECREVVTRGLELGYRHIDTAQAYENEKDVGQALIASGLRREEIFLTSKVWYTRLDYERVKSSTEKSLERLRTDYLDLMLVHWPNPEYPLDRTLGALMELQAEGKVRHVGVSNFPSRQLQDACEQAPIACLQIEYHPYLSQTTLLELAQRRGVNVVAYSPLARGRVFDDATLRSIGEKYGKTAGQIGLRWLLQQGVGAIPKARSEAHLRENFDVFDFELTEAEMKTIFGLHDEERIIDPAWAPEWD